MEYRNVYFRIRSRYQYDSGWPDESDATEFREESRRLFQSADWDLHPGGDGISDTVTKGQQDLYLHPMNFSGIIGVDEIPAIQESAEKLQRHSTAMVTTATRGIGSSRMRNTWRGWRANERKSCKRSWSGAGQNARTCI